MQKALLSKSKFLSLILRHEPSVIGLTLDAYGWADVPELLAKAAAKGEHITLAELEEIVATNEKKRFDWDKGQNRIRANQGHSIEVDLELVAVVPPEELFHGSAVKNQASIQAKGLVKGERQHVHLSTDQATAKMVGSRHGSPVIFRVASGEMQRRGHLFYQSKNGVWLVDHVPAEYLNLIDGR